MFIVNKTMKTTMVLGFSSLHRRKRIGKMRLVRVYIFGHEGSIMTIRATHTLKVKLVFRRQIN